MRDDLGNRMKGYENVTRNKLMKRSYTIIRIDGKAFHTYTRGFKRPFDDSLIDAMNQTAVYLCSNLQGVKLGFVQSDEISLLITDFDKLETQLLFDGNIQKICSVSASMATAKFNQLMFIRKIWNVLYFTWDNARVNFSNDVENMKLAEFDSRVFQLPTRTEVENYFIWRQQDATRNSIQSVAHSLYSHKELDRKNTDELQEMIFQKGINWNDYEPNLKRGRCVVRNPDDSKFEIDKQTPIFTLYRNYLTREIPKEAFKS